MIEVLRSRHLSLGPRVPAFEAAFAARVGAPHASAVSSGTAALHLAMRAVGVAEGTEVITSPFSFVASANSILYERARPVFVDIDPRDAEPRRRRGGGGDHARARRALLPVHIFGYPADTPGAGAPRAADRRGRLRGARRASTPTACRSAAAAIRPRSASTPTSS